MPHLLIAGKLHPAGLALLDRATGVTYDYVEEVSEPSYAPLIGKAEGLVIRTQPLSAATIADASRLKIVSRHGVGYDAVDVAALNERKIPLCIVGDVNSLSVAEHAMMLILACAKQAIRADRSVRTGPWGWRNRLGGGRDLGQAPADHRLRPQRAPSRADGRRFRHGHPRLRSVPRRAAAGRTEQFAPVASLADGLAWADVVSVHVPKAGRPVLGADEFAQAQARRHRRQYRSRRDRRRDGAGDGADRRARSPPPASTCSTTSRRRRTIRCSPSTRSCSRRTSPG